MTHDFTNLIHFYALYVYFELIVVSLYNSYIRNCFYKRTTFKTIRDNVRKVTILHKKTFAFLSDRRWS